MAATILHFAASGGGKTEQAKAFAKYEFRRTRKRGRLITAERYVPLMPVVEAGLIEVFDLWRVPVGYRFGVLRKLGEGFWPESVDCEWRSFRMLPPSRETWNEIGWYIVEGTTSISDCLMDETRKKNYCVGPSPSGGVFEQTIGNERLSFLTQSQTQYDLVQREMLGFINQLSVLPVDRVLFTAHEARGEEQDTRTPIFGPALVGKAATAKVPSWVDDCLHTDLYPAVKTVQIGGKTVQVELVEWRMYFTPHSTERTRIAIPAKPRLPLTRLLERWPTGFLSPRLDERGEMHDGLDEFLAFEDGLLEQGVENLSEWRKQLEQTWKAAQ